MKKVFITLITIVALVVVGAFVLNVIMPNTVTTMVNTVEGMIYNTTGLSMDFNGDNIYGSQLDSQVNNAGASDEDSAAQSDDGEFVSGFGGGD